MSGLFLNFYHLEIPSPSTIDFPTLPYRLYTTKEAFKQLKDDHPRWTFYRDGDLIYAWTRDENAEMLVNAATLPVMLSERPKLLAKMFELGVIDLIARSGGYRFFKNKHAGVWEIISQKDLLKGAIPGLVVNRVVHFSTAYFLKKINCFLDSRWLQP